MLWHDKTGWAGNSVYYIPPSMVSPSQKQIKQCGIAPKPSGSPVDAPHGQP